MFRGAGITNKYIRNEQIGNKTQNCSHTKGKRLNENVAYNVRVTHMEALIICIISSEIINSKLET